MEVHLEDLTLLSYFAESRADNLWIQENVDVNSEADVKALIRKFVKPQLDEMFALHPGFQSRLKECLRYFLNKKHSGIESIFEAREPPIDLPDDPLNYYRWAWDVLFGPEDYHLDSLAGYSEGAPVSPLPPRRDGVAREGRWRFSLLPIPLDTYAMSFSIAVLLGSVGLNIGASQSIHIAIVFYALWICQVGIFSVLGLFRKTRRAVAECLLQLSFALVLALFAFGLSYLLFYKPPKIASKETVPPASMKSGSTTQP